MNWLPIPSASLLVGLLAFIVIAALQVHWLSHKLGNLIGEFLWKEQFLPSVRRWRRDAIGRV